MRFPPAPFSAATFSAATFSAAPFSAAPTESRVRRLGRADNIERRLYSHIQRLPDGPQRDELLVMAQRAHR